MSFEALLHIQIWADTDTTPVYVGPVIDPYVSPKVALSTTSVFPESTSKGFELAGKLGFDGVEVMVSGLDQASTNPVIWQCLCEQYNTRVLAVHAPTLLITQRTWGTDPWGKLERAAEAAHSVGATAVVVHPPFRWQREYAHRFVDGLRRLTNSTGITFCLENMFPWRAPGGELNGYAPGWDPTNSDYEHLCLDLSHSATARMQALDYVEAWQDRLAHIHYTDGSGSFSDEHLTPGAGNQRAADVLAQAMRLGFSGHVVIEINTRRAGSKTARQGNLADALAFTRRVIETTELEIRTDALVPAFA